MTRFRKSEWEHSRKERGCSQIGKAMVFGAMMCRFESCHPCAESCGVEKLVNSVDSKSTVIDLWVQIPPPASVRRILILRIYLIASYLSNNREYKGWGVCVSHAHPSPSMNVAFTFHLWLHYMGLNKFSTRDVSASHLPSSINDWRSN